MQENIALPFKISDAITEYRFVKGDTTKTTNSAKYVEVATDSTAAVIGIGQETHTDDTDDNHLSVVVHGRSFLEVNADGSNLDIGDEIVPTTGGVGIKASAASATEAHIGAIALEPSTDDGDIIDVLVVHYPKENG